YKYKFSPSYDSVIYSGNELLRSSTDPINNLVQISDSIFWLDRMEPYPTKATPEFTEFSQESPIIKRFGHYPIGLQKPNQANDLSYFVKYSTIVPGKQKVGYLYIYHSLWKILDRSGN